MADSHVLQELLQFLTPSTRQDVKGKALEYVLSFTSSTTGRQCLCEDPAYTQALIGLTEDTDPVVCRDAFKGLINLSSEERIVKTLCNEKEFISCLLEMIADASCVLADAASMILSNVTRTEDGCQKVMDNLKGSDCSTDFVKLVEVFCNVGYNSKANLHHLGDVLSNLTQLVEGRKFILDREHCVIQRLLPFTQFLGSEVRRRGVIAALKNCCFEIDAHEWLLSDTVDILPHMLLPLAGPEELSEEDMDGLPDDLQYLDDDKMREQDAEIRKMLLEAIHKLCATKVCRQIVKDKKTYVILREFHKWEQDESVISACENVVSLLIMDEPGPGMENLNEIEVPDDMKKTVEGDTQEK
ncbi:protein HGH1 homolog [Amphiura filiformis]|uniref:protein HGH1 homolog n=1 Tax=Amphiura filiformis TaxID=82378 RepID=UPI003B2204D7